VSIKRNVSQGIVSSNGKSPEMIVKNGDGTNNGRVLPVQGLSVRGAAAAQAKRQRDDNAMDVDSGRMGESSRQSQALPLSARIAEQGGDEGSSSLPARKRSRQGKSPVRGERAGGFAKPTLLDRLQPTKVNDAASVGGASIVSRIAGLGDSSKALMAKSSATGNAQNHRSTPIAPMTSVRHPSGRGRRNDFDQQGSDDGDAIQIRGAANRNETHSSPRGSSLLARLGDGR